MATPHINAEMGDFADVVLMPGDPLRAKHIAETFLEDVREVKTCAACWASPVPIKAAKSP